MARPRWHETLSRPGNRVWKGWDQFVALWAVLNLVWVVVDLTYVPLRPSGSNAPSIPSPRLSLIHI